VIQASFKIVWSDYTRDARIIHYRLC